MFRSLALSVRELSATEAVLERIYEAAKLGLKKDSLAYAAGLLPDELRGLLARDPMVERAIGLGRADSEADAARTLHKAAADGDAKAALEILRHQHDWVAKQHIQVEGQISILAALQAANERVIEYATEKQPSPEASERLGHDGRGRSNQLRPDEHVVEADFRAGGVWLSKPGEPLPSEPVRKD